MALTTATILSEGKQLSGTAELLSIDIRRELNRIPSARLVLLDGDAAEQEFPLSDSAAFEPGKLVEIKLRCDGGADTTVFKGKVVRHGLEADSSGSVLAVELKDDAVKLTGARRSAVFRQMSDSDIFGKILRDAGLRTGTIDQTSMKHPEIVQYNCTDWDFLLARADALGFVAAVEDGSISIKKLAVPAAASISLEFGRSEIYEFEVGANAGDQLSSFQATSWKVKDLASDGAKAAAFKLAQGNLDGEKLAKGLGFAPHFEPHQVPISRDELQAWASACMARNRMSFYRGRFTVPGIPSVQLLQGLEIKGVGKRFDGRTMVTGFRHSVDQAGWRTDIQFGLPPERFTRNEDIVATPAGGMIPSAGGVQVGVVTAHTDDPEKLSRIKIKIPAIDDREEIWARLGSPYAGADRGYFFRPEIGDEVIVAFFNSDPRFPVILGSLFSSKNEPPKKAEPTDKDNNGKGIVTRAGVVIGFLDKDKASVFIETPKGRKILLDDDAEKIELTDANDNAITMDKSGIVIKSGKDFKIDASGNVEIKGQKVDVK